MGMFGARGARVAGKLFDVAAAGARSNTAKRLGNELAEWTTGQVVGSIVDPDGTTSRAGYLQTAATGKPGSALFGLVADTLFNAAKQSMAVSAQVPMPSQLPVLSQPQPSQAPSHTQNMSNILSSMSNTQRFAMPNVSLRDSAMDLASVTIGQRPLISQTFDVTSVLSSSFAPQKSLLQMFAQKSSDKPDEKPKETAEADSANKENVDSEVAAEPEKPTRNKI